MSAPGQMSASARKQQQDDIERLVKCRLRSEIEARKAVESTMKRAVQQARELKKELVLLRQEKEELRLAAQKSAVSAPGSSGNASRRYGHKEPAGGNRDSSAGKQSNNAVELELRKTSETLRARNTELEASMTELQQQVSELETERAAEIVRSTARLEGRDREVAALQDELKKTKIAADETKRKSQKMLKQKREEAQRALQENEQLARCAKTLQDQLALLPQLKKQLQHAKDKRADVAQVWQHKLEQRDQAFLREEEASKLQLAESAARIAELAKEKQDLQARLEALERKLGHSGSNHEAALRHEELRRNELEDATKHLQQKLRAAEAATREAEQAEVEARETQQQETRLRQLAEEAADAVEVRAEKAERGLAQAQLQLDRLEEALKARGVTLDYLLKQQTPASAASRTHRSSSKPSSTRPKAVPRDPARSNPTVKSRTLAGDAKASKRTTPRRSNNNEEE